MPGDGGPAELKLSPAPLLLGAGTTALDFAGEREHGWAAYRTSAPSPNLQVALPTGVRVAGTRRGAAGVGWEPGPGRPAIVAYCRDADPEERALRAQFTPLHAAALGGPLPWAAWTYGWAAVEAAAFVVALARASRAAGRVPEP